MVYLSILFALVAFLGGGLSYQAEQSMPGDILYPYKISFNEQFQQALLSDPVAKVAFDVTRIEAHITEARALALAGRLSPRAQTEVTDAITARVQNLTSILQELQSSGDSAGAATAAAAAHDVLSAQAAALADASAHGPIDQQVALAPVLTRLRTTTATVALLSTKLQAQASGVAKSSKQENTATAVSGL